MSVNAGALIPPAFGFKPLYVNGEHVGSAVEICAVCNIKKSFRVCAEGAFHKRSVKIKFRVYRRSLKADKKLLIGKRFVEKERFSVPCIVARAVAVRKQIVFIKIAFRIIIVWTIYCSPIMIVPYFSRRADNGARLASALGRRVAVCLLQNYISSVETPFII